LLYTSPSFLGARTLPPPIRNVRCGITDIWIERHGLVAVFFVFGGQRCKLAVVNHLQLDVSVTFIFIRRALSTIRVDYLRLWKAVTRQENG